MENETLAFAENVADNDVLTNTGAGEVKENVEIPEETPQVETVESETIPKTKIYSDNLNRAREEVREARENEQKLQDVLKNIGYEGTPEEIMLRIEADEAGMSVVQLREQREREAEMLRQHPEFKRIEAELAHSRATEANRWANDTLAEIKRINPKETATELSEIGDEYLGMLRAGVEPLAAYKFIYFEKAEQKKEQEKKKPIDIGAVGGVALQSEMTDDQANSYTKDDYRRDPSLIDRVMKYWNMKGK